MAIWYILHQSGIFYGLMVDFVLIWYIFPLFGILLQENLVTLLHTCRYSAVLPDFSSSKQIKMKKIYTK
jgi:hypothetical protein